MDSTPRRSKLLDVYTYISCVPSWRVTRYRLRERLRVPLYTYSTSHENASVVGMLPRNENEEKIWRIQTSNVFNRTNDFRPLVKNSKNRLRYKEKDLEEERSDKDDAWTIELCNFLKLTYDCSQSSSLHFGYLYELLWHRFVWSTKYYINHRFEIEENRGFIIFLISSLFFFIQL